MVSINYIIILMKKQNCWEYLKCGREPKGPNALTMGICPASLPGNGDGVNKGKNRGRICWAVTGTLCDGEVQGTFAKKQDTCFNCAFFSKVRKEERENFCLVLCNCATKKLN